MFSPAYIYTRSAMKHDYKIVPFFVVLLYFLWHHRRRRRRSLIYLLLLLRQYAILSTYNFTSGTQNVRDDVVDGRWEKCC